MKIGINTLLWTGGFGEADFPLLGRIKAWGFDLVEVSRFDFDGFPAAKVRRAVADEGLACNFCSALTGNLNMAGPEPGRAFDFVRRGIEVAAELGAPVFSGPFCAPVGYLPGRRKTDREWEQAVEYLGRLGPVLEQHGVSLALEALNRFETFFLNTAADSKRLVDEVGHPRVGILFDTFHANIEEKRVADAVPLLGSRIKNVHASENDRGIPGTGHVPWAEVFAALRGIGYDGSVVIESFGSTIPEIATAACIWRDLAPDSETLAREGQVFLRRAVEQGASATARPS
jgi:D-psicose/D-tagatose/L-ribulose 3-epimerase